MRWAAELAQFMFTIKYRSGRSNWNADALSRKTYHGEEPPVARLEELTSAPSNTLGNGTGTLIPACVRACAEEAMVGPLLQHSRVRSPSMEPQAMLMLPSISSVDMATTQRNNETIGRLW